MAHNCSRVTFVHADKAAFYFEDVDEELDRDGFRSRSVSEKWIKSNENKFLILNEEREFEVLNLSMEEQESQPENKFNVHVYNNSDVSGQKGAILYVNRNQKKVAVSCKNKLEIQPEEMDIPRDLDKHKALFYLTMILPSCYLLESSVYRSQFLAFETDDDDPSLSRLTLRHKEQDEVDEFCHITMQKAAGAL